MAFLSTCARRHLYALTRAADRIGIPHTRSVTTGRPRVPPSFSPLPASRRFESLPPSQQKNAAPNTNTPPRRPTDRHIPFAHVYVLDPTTHARSPTKHRLQDLLTVREERRGQPRRVVELVASTPEPVVRLTTRAEIEARYRTMRRAVAAAARTGAEPKEVQLSWGVAPGDVEHKMRKAKKDLEKGYRVAVVVTMKRGQRTSGREALVAFADEIAETLVGVGKECKEREITQRSMILTFRKVEVDEDVA
ncbi:hypothetical protein V8E55_002295 [Tylopilus felleus]